MNYKVGPVGISRTKIHTSPGWQHTIDRFLARACAGMQTDTFETCTSHIIFRDYAHRPILRKAQIVPGELEYTDTQFHDMRNDILYDLSKKHQLHIWTTGTHLSFPFILQLMLTQMSATLVHGAALAINGNGVLLPFFGEQCNPLLLTGLVQESNTIQLLGSDLVIVEKSGKMWPIQRPLHITPAQRSYFDYFKTNPWPRATTWRCTYQALHALLKPIGWHTRLERFVTDEAMHAVAPLKLLGRLALRSETIQLTHVIQLESVSDAVEPRIYALGTEQATCFLHNALTYALRDTVHVMIAQAAAGKTPLSRHLEASQAILAQALSTIPSHALTRLTMPEHLTEQEYARLAKPQIINFVETMRVQGPRQPLPRTPSQQAQ